LVVYSVLLTRGIDGEDSVLSDMDQGFGACSMIGRHNYATQELVNLLLYGRAHSNVFDGTHSLPGEKPGEFIVLRGTPFQGNRRVVCGGIIERVLDLRKEKDTG
jgi:ubiquitin carboxyl-terminal hydrolase MINDY-3/4